MSGLKAQEDSYASDGQYVLYRAGGKPGKRKIRQVGDSDWVETFDRIPIIDFTNIYHPDVEVRRKLAMELADAAENVGFWYAANTPVDDALIEETFGALENFFGMPTEKKMEASWVKTPGVRGYESFEDVAKNDGLVPGTTTRESFVMGDDMTDPVQYNDPVPDGVKPQNIWPPSRPEFKQALDKYYSALMPFGRGILHLFALALGLDESALDEYHKFPMCALRALHYPSQETEETGQGFLAHADFSSFTLVLQGKNYGSGLEVLNMNGHWIPAPCLPGTTFTCNVGDYLQTLSSGRFVSTVHRVVNRSGKERYSLPFFWSPDPSAVLVPVPNAKGQREGYEQPDTTETIGKQYTRRLMFARRLHPTAKRLVELNIPESEWDYSYLTGSLP